MIKAKFWDDQKQEWGKQFRLDAKQAPPVLTDRFDEGLSTAVFQCYTNDIPTITPIEVWTKCELVLDGKSFIGFVSGYKDEMVVFGNGKKGNRLATIELIELLGVTQYMPMSNLCFTNDIESKIDPVTAVVSTKVTPWYPKSVINRLSNQLYNLPNGEEAPFRMSYPSAPWWALQPLPEMSFTEATLFDALKQIGEAVGGFPFLTFVASGYYELDFRQWDNRNSKLWQDENISMITRSATIENQGFIVDSTVKNMLAVSPNGDNMTVFPAVDAFKSISAEEYITEVKKGDAFFEVDRPIQQILKVELTSYSINKYFLGSSGYKEFTDVTPFFVEFDYWKTLPEGIAFINDIVKVMEPTKRTRAYYSYSNKKIQGLTNMWMALKFYYFNQMNFFQLPPLDLDELNPLNYQIRVTYIPLSTTRLIFKREGAAKPIGQVYNQESNIISASSYGSSLQGLAHRIHGKSSTVSKRVKRGSELYFAGEWLNGEIIVCAEHQYTPTEILSTYTLSENFNRRNEYIYLPHEQRQWEIPSGEKVRDRNLLYTEEMQVSINEVLPEGDGVISGGAMLQFAINYDEVQEKPSLAYVAWKSRTQIEQDADPEYSGDYALATVTTIPVGRSISFHWETADNASMGGRSYRWDLSEFPPGPLHQKFIEYSPKSIWVNWRLSNKAPLKYNFKNKYTGAGGFFPAEEVPENKTFQFTFPLSNKEQWAEAEYIAEFVDFKIEKDISERILFTYLLNFVGKNDTIVYEQAAVQNSLCNSAKTKGFKIYVSADEKYGFWDTKGKGTPFEGTLLEKNIINKNGHMKFSFGFDGAYHSLGITDNNDNLLFATNKSGQGGTVDLYMSNRRIEWVKI